MGEHHEAKALLRQLALGELSASGRELASRVSAARSWERLTRDEVERAPPKPPQFAVAAVRTSPPREFRRGARGSTRSKRWSANTGSP